MKKMISLAATCLLVTASTAVTAQDAVPAPETQEEAAITALDQELSEKWDAHERGLFVYLGYYSAASIMCDDLELDPAKLGKVLKEGFLNDEQGSVDEVRERHVRLIGALAMATGVFMGLRSHDKADFCTEAATARENSKDSSSLFKD